MEMAWLSSLVNPEVPANQTFHEPLETLRNHLKPGKLTERFRFHKRSQRDGETVSQFEAELRSLASICEFGEFLEQALREHLVCHIKNKEKTLNKQRKLLMIWRNVKQ